MNFKDKKISVIGLGYVGLPLAVEFSKIINTVGFDIDPVRINELKSSFDRTGEIQLDVLKNLKGIEFTSNYEAISDSNIYIITVPTPVDKFNCPNLEPLIKATEIVGKFLKINDVVIYESTVYPGVTEEICAIILENVSKLKFNVDFFCGYSPERINPGDKIHTLKNIVKITSGSTEVIAKFVNSLYGEIISAGTYMAPSIKVAEAAKVIENAQRDINIAFVNELSIIFNLLNIDTIEVLNAASTKWNFINFKPGLVGGHCIGVDPFYLAQKAQEVGYYPEIILAGRRLNDKMGEYVANRFVKLLISKNLKIKNLNILILGLTFKENCPDLRNSKVFDIINELKKFEINVEVFDPWVIKSGNEYDFDFTLKSDISNLNEYSGVLIAVAHDEFLSLKFSAESIIFDLKGIYNKDLINSRL
jgi:UDP-N-acetyl-D-galactosamine dehydrogenase